MMRVALLMVLWCMLASTSQASVNIDSSRLAAEMKYWLCAADGETADVLLHVMAEKTISETSPATCATFSNAVAAVSSAATSKRWVPPASNDKQQQQQWAGCSDTSCPTLQGNVALKIDAPTYIRLLEFGHEQATYCKDARAAIDSFVKNLVSAGCATRECGVMDYVAARPTTAGCRAILLTK